MQAAYPRPKLSLKEELETFSHIELTEDELDAAVLEAKKIKERRLEEQKVQARVEENRRLFTGQIWTSDQTEYFLRYRAVKLFDGKFKFEGQVSLYFMLLVLYFSRDENFYQIAKNMDIKNPSLDKGIFIGGNFGVGKTWLMKLCQRNQRQCYALQNAKAIADLFEKEGEESMKQFIESPELPVNDAENFYQRKLGLCIDDLGTEQIKNHYGNKKNVIGDLIELRYAKGNTGVLLHATTNLTGQQLSDFYGGRVASRLREVMNVIDFVGSDLRK